jgi:pimeloyl-ACP methyl ester carboxylesterase
LIFLSIASALGIVALLLAGGIAYQWRGLQQDRNRHLPPGRFVTVANRRLHVHETGSGRPAVIFESGLASSSLSWYPVQQLVAERTRAVSYDRAGIGWSDEDTSPRTVQGMIDDLAEVLKNSGIRPPYVLVGHSFGALLVRAYASLRREDIAGLVLVDPVSLDLWADCSEENRRRLRLGAKLSRRGVFLANIGVVRLALASLASGKTRFSKAVAKASAGKAMGTMGRLTGVVQKLPSSLIPSVQSHWSQAKSFRAMAEYLEILPRCAAEVRATEIASDLPMTILSAANATAQELGERELWAQRSIRGRHVQIAGSTHWIHLEHPEEVASAILELVKSDPQGSDLNSTS